MISPATIDAVRERADLVSVVGEAGIHLRREGASLKALCPFHSEKTPSFHVNPRRNFYFCYGCRAGGDAIAFVMQSEGLDFPGAVRELAERLGIDVDEGTPQDREAAERAKRERESLYTVNALAAAFYERSLWGETAARSAVYAHEELERRGLDATPTDESEVGAALRAFRVGYAPATWDGLARHLSRIKAPLAPAVRAGLVLEHPRQAGRYYDRFRHRLIFPVLNHVGQVVAFSGRTLEAPEERYLDDRSYRERKPPAKYVNSPESAIYTKGEHLFGLWQAKDAVRTAGEALLVEGNFDVVALHARGVCHAVAPLGTAFTEAQARLLRRFTSAVVVAFDGDRAGRKATYDARVSVRAGRLDARAVSIPAGADPDSFVRSHGTGAFVELVRRAPSLREHLLRQLLSEDGGADSRGQRLAPDDARARRVKAAVALLGEETDPTVRALAKAHADQLAGGLVVNGRAPRDLRDLEMSIRRAQRRIEEPEAPEVPPLADPLGFSVVACLLDAPGVVRLPEVADVVALLRDDLAEGAAAAQKVAVADILDATPAPLRPHVERRLAAPVYASEAAAASAVVAAGGRLRERARADEEAALRRAITTADAAGDDAEVERLLAQLDSMVSA